MASPFAMLSMISKARRAAAKRKEEEAAASKASLSLTSPSTSNLTKTTTTTSTATGSQAGTAHSASTANTSFGSAAPSTDDLLYSDTASIISTTDDFGSDPKSKKKEKELKDKEKKKRRLTSSSLLSLARRPTLLGGSSEKKGANGHSGLSSSVVLGPEVDTGPVVAEPEELTTNEIKPRESNDGFSVLHMQDEPDTTHKPPSVADHEADWTEVAAPPPPSTPAPVPAAQAAPPRSIGIVDENEAAVIVPVAEEVPPVPEAPVQPETQEPSPSASELLEAERTKTEAEAEARKAAEAECKRLQDALLALTQEKERLSEETRVRAEASDRELKELKAKWGEERVRVSKEREAERAQVDTEREQERAKVRVEREAERTRVVKEREAARAQVNTEREQEQARVKAEREEERARVAREREAERSQLARDRQEERSRVARERAEEREAWNKQKELLGERLVNAEAGVENEEKTRKRLEKEVAVLKREKDDISRSVPPLQELVTTMRKEMAKMKELVATRERNEAALESQLTVLRREKAEATQAVVPLQQLVATLKDQAKKSKELAETRQKDAKSLEEELRRLGEQREASLTLKDAHISSVNAALRDAKEELTKLRSSVDERATQAGSTIASLKQKLAQFYQSEDERNDRVISDQMKRQASDIRFTGGAEDRKGYAEPVDAAINVLYTLNSEIFQAAASFADSVEMETKPEVQLEELELLIAKMTPVLSRDLITSLRSAYTEPTDVPNPLLLQVAFQSCVAYCCNRFITSWYPLHWDYGNFLQILHSRILETGQTQLAENWRSTTRALLRLTSESHPQFTAYLRQQLVDILAICGRSMSNSATQALANRFEEKFSIIGRLAIRMHILLNDTPSNLETFIAQPGSSFKARMMEDTYADDDGDSSDSSDLFHASLKQVICTSDIGLQRLPSKGGGRSTVVVKPKVVLATILSQEW
ncbi:hypothetical protein MD484_g2684, partial [Candolleomyces efflorescens]